MLTSVEAVIEALGAATAAELAGVSVKALWNWKDRGWIPAEYFLVFSEALKLAGKPQPDRAVFKMKAAPEPAEARP